MRLSCYSLRALELSCAGCEPPDGTLNNCMTYFGKGLQHFPWCPGLAATYHAVGFGLSSLPLGFAYLGGHVLSGPSRFRRPFPRGHLAGHAGQRRFRSRRRGGRPEACPLRVRSASPPTRSLLRVLGEFTPVAVADEIRSTVSPGRRDPRVVPQAGAGSPLRRKSRPICGAGVVPTVSPAAVAEQVSVLP